MLKISVLLLALAVVTCHGMLLVDNELANARYYYEGQSKNTFSLFTACTNPKVKSSTYSTENHYFSIESVYIAQVEVDCGGEVCMY